MNYDNPFRIYAFLYSQETLHNQIEKARVPFSSVYALLFTRANAFHIFSVGLQQARRPF